MVVLSLIIVASALAWFNSPSVHVSVNIQASIRPEFINCKRLELQHSYSVYKFYRLCTAILNNYL